MKRSLARPLTWVVTLVAVSLALTLTPAGPWLSTAFSTYVLHSEHGNGYQWGSGGPGFLWIIQLAAWVSVAYHLVLAHNCYEHGCKRPARILGEDGHKRCKRCHALHHPDYEPVHIRDKIKTTTNLATVRHPHNGQVPG